MNVRKAVTIRMQLAYTQFSLGPFGQWQKPSMQYTKIAVPSCANDSMSRCLLSVFMAQWYIQI